MANGASSMPDHHALLGALLPALLEAGRIEMKYFEGTIVVERKDDQSPVTAADREAEVILLAALARTAPGIPVVAEEAAAAGSIPRTQGTFFLVDPLDGTREFIKKRPEFTVNIGLIEAGRPVFGVVYTPASGQLFATVSPGQAAETHLPLDASSADPTTLRWTPLRTRRPDPDALVAVESYSHRSPETGDVLEKLGAREVRRAGSSLKFCLIARGEIDVYPRIGPTCEWDTAAAHAVLSAAGGSVRTLDGRELAYGKAPKYLNPHFIAWGSPEALMVLA